MLDLFGLPAEGETSGQALWRELAGGVALIFVARAEAQGVAAPEVELVIGQIAEVTKTMCATCP